MVAVLTLADRAFAWLLQVVILAASAIVTLSLVALVIFRVFFSQSLLGMHEASLLAAMWLYMAGAVMASRRSEHLVVDFLATSLRAPRAQAIHGLVVAVLTLVIAAIFALWVWSMLAWGMKRPQIIPVLNLPLWYAQAPLALAAVSAVLYALRDIVRAGLRIAQPGKEA